MKYVLYVIAAIVAFLLFAPETGTTEIRNLPLLITVVAVIVGFLIYYLIRRAVFFWKSQKGTEKERL